MIVAVWIYFHVSNNSNDDIVLGLFILLVFLWSAVRLWLRRRTEKRWPKTDGTITSKQVSVQNKRGGTLRASFRYSFTVNADSLSGEFYSSSTWEDTANADANMIEVGRSVVVRYNPSNPQESLVWAKDNPDIPFKLELSEVEFR